MATWMIRSGRNDVFLAGAIKHQVAIIAFHPLPDLADIPDSWSGKVMLRERLETSHPRRAAGTLTKWTNEIWAFLHLIEPDDRIIMPYSSGRRAWVGIWEQANYAFRQDIRPDGVHAHPVRWCDDVVNEELDDEMASFWMRRATVVKVG